MVGYLPEGGFLKRPRPSSGESMESIFPFDVSLFHPHATLSVYDTDDGVDFS